MSVTIIQRCECRQQATAAAPTTTAVERIYNTELNVVLHVNTNYLSHIPFSYFLQTHTKKRKIIINTHMMGEIKEAEKEIEPVKKK